MKSELQFFMSSADEDEFVSMAKELSDSINKESDSQWHFMVGDCPIQFLRSEQYGNELSAGRISIMTTGFYVHYRSSKSAESIYKKMRKWIKTRYSNDLVCRNINIKGSEMKVRYFWVGPYVKQAIEPNKPLVLTIFKNSPVVFEIQSIT